MGAWGTGNFDNDTALDWVYDLEEYEDTTLIEQTLNAIDEEDIDASSAEEALIAIEVIARLLGNFKDDAYSEDVDKWVKANPLEVSDELLEKAKKTIVLILGENSELRELWEETNDYQSWIDVIKELDGRLRR
ncbi:MAG: hypothetical protein KU38_10475 [Sulfurovum sp. FS08-3]|nr:MAG: hypothetical protein KU38_10475 [Sulfurovum sp. FS08-3]